MSGEVVKRKPNRKTVSKSMDLVSSTRESSERWWDKPSLQWVAGALTVKKGHGDGVCSPLLQEAPQRKEKV